MDWYWWALIVLGALSAVCLFITLICFFFTFYSSKRIREKRIGKLPKGAAYKALQSQINDWINQLRSMPHRKVELTTHDGLVLRGKYYEKDPNAPIELMLHGYKSNHEADLSGGVFRALNAGHNVLLFDHRASGRSDGSVITFGILESKDCIAWVDYILKNINPNAQILLTGISMGAATVMIAASKPLPENVLGVLADCGYTSAKDIIQKVMRDMYLPDKFLYPFAKLAAKLLGKFDLEEISPIESMRKCRLPVLFFHGDADSFVPCDMSEKNFEACAAEQKRLVIIKGAEHGLCFTADAEGYLAAISEFFGPILQKNVR